MVKIIEFPIGFFFREIHTVIHNPFSHSLVHIFPEMKPCEFFHPVPGQFPIGCAGIIPPAYYHDLSIKWIAACHFHVIEGRKQLTESQISGSSEYCKCIFITHQSASIHDGNFLPGQSVHRYALRSSPSGPGSDWLPPAFRGRHPGMLPPGS